MPTHKLKVGTDLPPTRLDIFLTTAIEGEYSRAFLKQMIEAGQVTVNGEANAKPSFKVSSGDEIVIDVDEAVLIDDSIKPEKIDLNIFYEDEDILVINKPSGMLVHPAQGKYTGTLVNAILYHCQELSTLNDETRPGIVHRLDQETSGVMVVAKNNRSHRKLAKQFERHEIQKKYLAIVQGSINFDEGLIDAPLGKHYRHHEKKQIAYDDLGKDAQTIYKVIKRFKNATYVALYPKTGRTHQLRVHMVHLGHPILGDEKYGKKETFPRLALHAQGLKFTHPTTEQTLEFSCKPPKEFLSFKD